MGAGPGAVTWRGGGAWPACLLSSRARAQKAEHVVWALLAWAGCRPSAVVLSVALGGGGAGREM